MDIVVCMPDIKKEGIEKLTEFYNNAKSESEMLYFRVPFLPKKAFVSDRCFLVSNGFVIGSHMIVNLAHIDSNIAKTLIHGNWKQGYYIIRDSKTWEKLDKFIECKGNRWFRSFRYRWWKLYKGEW